ncbi:MAG TPA: hypothetical protein VG388_12045 [Solirubrobacteraceae bacterium]|jgi:hypothetical protein|nr:hypothetical protein [Solirubrobacteraceae bacterium]
MLTTRAADADRVIHRAIVLIALVCSGLVLASFVMFARDQIAGASKTQANAVSASVPTQPVAAAKRKPEAQPGRFINDAAGRLTSPFDSIIHSNSAWVERSVPAIIAVLVYGFGLGYLARYTRGLA